MLIPDPGVLCSCRCRTAQELRMSGRGQLAGVRNATLTVDGISYASGDTYAKPLVVNTILFTFGCAGTRCAERFSILLRPQDDLRH